MSSSNIYLTFDIDWAQDKMMESILEELLKRRMKSTWFVTHATPLLQVFRKYGDLFDLGIHPNFLEGTTHGESEEEILQHVSGLVPEAKVIRTHSVFQSGPLLSKIANLKSIQLDSSIFLPEMSNIQPVKHLTPNGPLFRLPIFWADDYELLKPQSDWTPEAYFKQEGHKVFLFHPVHLFLNSAGYSDYELFKKGSPGPSYAGTGAMDFFLQLIDFLEKTNLKPHFLKDIL
tara:strand:+ start:1397 stop:2089 length:693 start_codon:yes stop_codon:yes gene_type:complete